MTIFLQTSYLQATSNHLDALRHLLATARYSYKNIGDEDLRLLIERGVVILAYDGPALWGAFGIALEERPKTLPENAFNRGSVTVAAFMPGYWPGDWLPQLITWAEKLISQHVRPVHIASHSPANWMERGLLNADFEIEEQIVNMVLERVGKVTFPKSDSPLTQLRPATPADLPALAAMDGIVFDPLWHFGEKHLLELLWRGRMQLATLGSTIVGYSSLLNNSYSEAQLARLAVTPLMQGKGVGRQLLIDAIDACRELGYQRLALNTQVTNKRSQTLYTSFGFRPFGDKVSVLTKSVY